MGTERINDLIFKPLPKPEIFKLKQESLPKTELPALSGNDKQLLFKQESLGNDALKLKLFNQLGQTPALLKNQPSAPAGFTEPYPPGAALQFSETKSSCYLASQGQEGEVYQYPDGSYWRVDDLEVQDSGLRAVTLREVVPDGNGGYIDNPNDDRVIVAFAGSNALDDWDDNILQGGGLTPKQYDQALEYSNGVIGQAQAKGETVSFAGHSLGGGVATYCSIKTGLPASTINAAPLSNNKIPDDVNFDNQITHYYVDEEPLTRLDDANPTDFRPGKHIEIEGRYKEIEADWWNPLDLDDHLENIKRDGKNHSLDNSAPEVGLPNLVSD